MELLEAIQTRRSIRKFKENSIPEEYLKELLEAGRLAPSGSNLQPTRYVVIQSKEERDKLKQCTPLPFVAQAPVVIAICVDNNVMSTAEVRTKELIEAKAFLGTPLDKKTEDSDSYAKRRKSLEGPAFKAYLDLNAAIAIDHITLRAVDLGLGSCWVMMFDKEKAKELLQIDERYDVVALLPIGYPDQSPSPRPRVEMDELILKKI